MNAAPYIYTPKTRKLKWFKIAWPADEILIFISRHFDFLAKFENPLLQGSFAIKVDSFCDLDWREKI